ncbi:3-oxoacyl-(acyl-carrier-protein) synthase [Gelidibacter algens]|uniref:3-oxoacyl-(Acyl-carrier-protein) synthase n=1 Tax=Gelidibacter algens TaxID=49280 RepID=A0A1A7R3J8_9FLAO|nr:beta-ketoacyl synthase N-terminal-like domain-containing protein [Gelidibacter algens]OBX26078.1 beta-ketoacyl synthase [Gelidibacter algens]RAJ22964.1 3-oxoacyl-(acyl-carrier-protein) synthase [Gelidibacter algens]
MQHPISITSICSISPLGGSLEDIWQRYQNNAHCLSEKSFDQGKAWVGQLPSSVKLEIKALKNSDPLFKNLDPSVLYAIYTARKAVAQSGWIATDNFGINIGSSRGATELFEKYHAEFLKQGRAKTLSSPTTTLGNISSWVAHDLQTQGPEISHSITCSTALHALLNGVAWINSGMCDKFLVGGSEAPLTAFTVAQMQALKIYAPLSSQINESESGTADVYYPCRSLDLNKTGNSMVLGEAAAMACLEKGNSQKALATIIGVGYATELLEHNVSVSSDAKCFQRSMKMALGTLNPDAVDIIITHTPGTLKGDSSEINAIKTLFCNKIPALTTNKWKIGHSLGASGLLNVEMAVLMLQHQTFIPVPFIEEKKPERNKTIMVNAVGFGGNAVSILISK